VREDLEQPEQPVVCCIAVDLLGLQARECLLELHMQQVMLRFWVVLEVQLAPEAMVGPEGLPQLEVPEQLAQPEQLVQPVMAVGL